MTGRIDFADLDAVSLVALDLVDDDEYQRQRAATLLINAACLLIADPASIPQRDDPDIADALRLCDHARICPGKVILSPNSNDWQHPMFGKVIEVHQLTPAWMVALELVKAVKDAHGRD